MRKFIGWWLFIVFCFLVLTFALAIRVYHLNLLPIFADEAIYIRWAQVMQAESTLRFLPLSDGKQPLFMWVVIPFLKLISNPLVAGRLTSVLTGMGTLVGVIVLTLSLFRSKKAALVAALVYAVSPFSLFFDRMALVDSMLSFFGVWTLILALYALRQQRLDMAMLAGFTLGGAYLTKSTALFFLLLLPSTLILVSWPDSLKGKTLLFLRLCFLILVTVFISQAIFNILRLGPNFHLLKSRNYDYVFPLSHLISRPLDPLVPHLKDILNWLVKMGPSPLILLFSAGVVMALKHHFIKEVILLGFWLMVPLLIQSEYAKVFTARYIFFTLPFLFILSSLWVLGKSRLTKLLSLFIFLGFLVLALRQDYYFLFNPPKADLPRGERSGYLEEWTSGYGIAEAADYLRKEYQNTPQEKIVVGTEGYFGTLPDGLQIYLNDLRDITIVGTEVKFEDVPQKLLDSMKGGNKVYLLANSTRVKFSDYQKRGLELIASYPKASRTFDTREYYLYGPQEKLLFFRLYPKSQQLR